MGIFFLSSVGFFPSMSQSFCSSHIILIHHVFSLLVYIISLFSSDPSLIYRFMYAYLQDWSLDWKEGHMKKNSLCVCMFVSGSKKHQN
jgi:hypothetical protein